MGKAEENKQKKRTALLSQSFSLFMNKGISKTTISDIVEKAGVAKGTFYQYFKDKEDLVEKLIAQKAETLLNNSIKRLDKEEREMDTTDKLIFIADDLLEQLRNNKKLLIFINKNLNTGFLYKALTNKEVKKEVDVLGLLKTSLETEDGEWSDPDLMLYTIIELVNSTCYTIILRNYPVDLETYKPYLFECIRSIIQAYKVP